MNKIRITPLGTCRIHTALKRGGLRYPIELDLGRNYGFTHTVSEALQLLRFLNAEQDIPPHLAPLIMSGGELATFARESWAPADLHVVEISSAKKLMSGDHVVQLNQVQRHYADFFSDRERSRRFWNLVKAGNRMNVVEFARAQPPFRLLSREDRELLFGISFEQQSFKAIRAEMATIVERLGADKVMFVTHVNARGPDDEVIPSRDRLVRWVKLAAEQLGVKVFDPTRVMASVGQDRALESGGLDLTHYTPAFSDRVCDELYHFHIGTLVGTVALDGDDASGATAAVAAHLEAALENDDFVDTAKQIHAELARSPESVPLTELRGLVSAKIGDFARAAEDLGMRDDKALSQPMRITLLQALTSLGRSAEALVVARNLINDEYEDAEVYASASIAAEQIGRSAEAIRYAKAAFRLRRDDLSPALRVLRLLSEQGLEEEVAQWRAEVLAHLGNSSNGAFDLCRWAIRNRDEEIFAAAIPGVSEKGTTIDMVEEAFGNGLYGAVAEVIGPLAELGPIAPPLAARRAALIEALLAKSAELFEAGEGNLAFRCANALAALAEAPSEQLRTARIAALAQRQMQTALRDLRLDIRAAEKTGPDAVIAVAESAGDLVRGDAVIIVAVARALQAVDRAGDALKLLFSANPDVREDIQLRRATGRIATQAEDYGTAIETYGALRADGALPAEHRAEADRMLSSIGIRALGQLRELMMAEQFEQALALAATIERHTDEGPRVQRELRRMHRRLQVLVTEIEQGDGSDDELERILRLIAQIRPDDQAMLRRLALELMRQLRFAEAATVWDSVHLLAPSNDAAVHALNRCRTLARRRSATMVQATV